MTKLAMTVLLAVVCGGCVGTMDSVSVIRGHLVLKDGTDLNGCTVTPYLGDSNEPLSKYERTVDSQFLVSLVNAPTSGTAILEFNCPGMVVAARTSPISLKEASEPSGIDIGPVVVDR